MRQRFVIWRDLNMAYEDYRVSIAGNEDYETVKTNRKAVIDLLSELQEKLVNEGATARSKETCQ